MVREANGPSDAGKSPVPSGASHEHRDTTLDRERAASMADEGGVAGASVEAREQTTAAAARRQGGDRTRRSPWTAVVESAARLTHALKRSGAKKSSGRA